MFLGVDEVNLGRGELLIHPTLGVAEVDNLIIANMEPPSQVFQFGCGNVELLLELLMCFEFALDVGQLIFGDLEISARLLKRCKFLFVHSLVYIFRAFQ